MSHSEPIPYRYRLFPLLGGTAILYISVTPEAEAPLGNDTRLWTNLLANAVEKHGNALTLGILKVGNQSYVPEPVSNSMKIIWSTYKSFIHERLAEDEDNWPMDAATAVR